MTVTEAPGVWGDLVGQQRVVATLRNAVAGGRHAMTHAWLVVGHPGRRHRRGDHLVLRIEQVVLFDPLSGDRLG